MKLHHACITAAVLLLLTVLGTFFCARFLRETASYIIDQLEELPDGATFAAEDVKAIQSFWEERRKFLNFTLSESALDDISLHFDELLVAINNSNEEEYQKATARLKRAVESIYQLEKISLSNIF